MKRKQYEQPEQEINKKQGCDIFMPAEIISSILLYCDPLTLIVAQFVCQEWYYLRKHAVCMYDIVSIDPIVDYSSRFKKWFARLFFVDNPIPQKIINEASLNGDVKFVKLLCEYGAYPDCDTMGHAAAGGHMKMVKWLRDNYCPWDGDASASAAAHGHSELALWMLKEGCPMSSKFLPFAVFNADVFLMDYFGFQCLQHSRVWYRTTLFEHRALDKENPSWVTTPFSDSERAVEMEKREKVIQWYIKKGVKDCSVTAYYAHVGDFEKLKWAYEIGCPISQLVYQWVGFNGRIDMAEWLIKIWPLSREVVTYAAKGGKINMLEWYDTRCGFSGKLISITTEAMTFAAGEGHLDVLKWLKEKGYPICSATSAIRGGHVHVVKWLMNQESFLVDSEAMVTAATQENIEIMELLKVDPKSPVCEDMMIMTVQNKKLRAIKWLVEKKGFTIEEKHYGKAAEKGFLSFFKWARNNATWEDMGRDIGLRAVEGGHLDLLKWARDDGKDWDGCEMEAALRYNHFEIVKWLVEQGFPCEKMLIWGSRCYDDIARTGKWRLLKWLKENDICGWSRITCSVSIEQGHWSVARKLIENGCKFDPSVAKIVDDKDVTSFCQWLSIWLREHPNSCSFSSGGLLDNINMWFT
jgi:hypothetical protein